LNAEQGKEDGCESEQTSHRKIDTRGDNDQSHSTCKNTENRDVSQHVAMCVPFEKTSLCVENQSEEKDKEQSHQSAKNRRAEPGFSLPLGLDDVSGF
jgi:hypothetical protein